MQSWLPYDTLLSQCAAANLLALSQWGSDKLVMFKWIMMHKWDTLFQLDCRDLASIAAHAATRTQVLGS